MPITRQSIRRGAVRLDRHQPTRFLAEVQFTRTSVRKLRTFAWSLGAIVLFAVPAAIGYRRASRQ
ncbi:hypothetical protein [Nocardia amamiensis]|uniref:hypothetical protein n=1 Tax=Nocardia TaxID=1817 RepID=UPI0033C7503A